MAMSAKAHEEGPRIIPMQPMPGRTRHFYLAVGGRVVTVITRHWSEGEEGRCRLCRACSAAEGVCTVAVTRKVEPGSCALFSTVGLRPGGLVGGAVGSELIDGGRDDRKVEGV